MFISIRCERADVKAGAVNTFHFQPRAGQHEAVYGIIQRHMSQLLKEILPRVHVNSEEVSDFLTSLKLPYLDSGEQKLEIPRLALDSKSSLDILNTMASLDSDSDSDSSDLESVCDTDSLRLFLSEPASCHSINSPMASQKFVDQDSWASPRARGPLVAQSTPPQPPEIPRRGRRPSVLALAVQDARRAPSSVSSGSQTPRKRASVCEIYKDLGQIQCRPMMPPPRVAPRS